VRALYGSYSYSKRLEETSRAPAYHLAEGIDADVQSANIGIHSARRILRPMILFSGDVIDKAKHH